MKDLFSVAGKVALVTGGSRGIGAMIAEGFVANGVKTYITARNETELQATAERLSQQGQCIGIASDLSSLAGIEDLASQLKSCEQKLHILVNNAGASWGAPIDDFPEQGWDKVMTLNAKSPFFMIQKMLPQLSAAAAQDSPSRVINIASIHAFLNPGVPNYSYAASKAAIVQLTRHLACDLVGEHVHVNAIAPGYFLSKMTSYLSDAEHQAQVQKIPCARAGNAQDAAGTALYLASAASDWMIGQILILDGGIAAQAG
jgi:NAD(P)-dependent dehydrogenase (short-subunit alcohol dehydrogenase family)